MLLAAPWPGLLVAYLAWVVASWAIAAFAADFMLRLTAAVTAITPLVLLVILLAAFAHDATRQ